MKKSNFFWIGFSDLMTSLFFVMLVLYVVSFTFYKKQIINSTEIDKELKETRDKLAISEKNLDEAKSIIGYLKTENDTLRVSAKKIKLIEAIEENLEPLKKDTILFRYEGKHKRFTLAFDVEFNTGRRGINNTSLKKFVKTSEKIKEVGVQLKKTIDDLAKKKISDPRMKNVSYIVIISGYASKLLIANESVDYIYSYERAYNLWKYWKDLGINFEDERYKGLVDLQISGNGWGGVGRFKRDRNNRFENETKNQRFIIQIIPKIGKAD
ncbi:hypothetical protein [uncultured Dokdonia sp.]|uniref:hypothetical protein n=1 Tax=uncultured Dokdonia sp. TaxID=575653 RepID=UPI0026082A0F|nr:hypothetical protein [uncultured Dokdonia sp.]